jgi:uncharacterized membrane protein (UPF0127 family)/CheY-like chemotaxis protein
MAKTKLIVNLTRGGCLCVGELADRPFLRMRGLIGRRGLPAGEGMLLRPESGIHTAFMRFPIDALFLDRNLRVLDIVEQLRPWRMANKYRARAVLELPAGEIARRRVEVGDRLELRDRATADVVSSQVLDTVETPHPQSSAALQTPELARLRPLRVLVISHDGHFRSVMSLLLGRHNCSVTTTANSSRISELIAKEDADVVVIDASGLSAMATAAVEARAQPVGVVVVNDDNGSEMDGPAVLAKWGPFEDLLSAIEWAGQRRGTWGGDSERR